MLERLKFNWHEYRYREESHGSILLYRVSTGSLTFIEGRAKETFERLLSGKQCQEDGALPYMRYFVSEHVFIGESQP